MSAMSILFKNIAKKANDLLSDKNTSKKFSVATEAANGTKYNAEASISGASVSGKVGASLKHDSGFNVDKVEFDNKGTRSVGHSDGKDQLSPHARNACPPTQG